MAFRTSFEELYPHRASTFFPHRGDQFLPLVICDFLKVLYQSSSYPQSILMCVTSAPFISLSPGRHSRLFPEWLTVSLEPNLTSGEVFCFHYLWLEASRLRLLTLTISSNNSDKWGAIKRVIWVTRYHERYFILHSFLLEFFFPFSFPLVNVKRCLFPALLIEFFKNHQWLEKEGSLPWHIQTIPSVNFTLS